MIAAFIGLWVLCGVYVSVEVWFDGPTKPHWSNALVTIALLLFGPPLMLMRLVLGLSNYARWYRP